MLTGRMPVLLRHGRWSHDFGVGGVEAFHPFAVFEPLLRWRLAGGAAALVFPIEIDTDAVDLEPAIAFGGGLERIDQAGADDAAHDSLVAAAHDLAGILDLYEAFFLHTFGCAEDGLILWRGWANELGCCGGQAEV